MELQAKGGGGSTIEGQTLKNEGQTLKARVRHDFEAWQSPRSERKLRIESVLHSLSSENILHKVSRNLLCELTAGVCGDLGSSGRYHLLASACWSGPPNPKP